MTAEERRYDVTLVEHTPEGRTKELLAGRCSAFVLAICADVNGELRVLTLHEGPTRQRRKAITALTEHIRATIGLSGANSVHLIEVYDREIAMLERDEMRWSWQRAGATARQERGRGGPLCPPSSVGGPDGATSG